MLHDGAIARSIFDAGTLDRRSSERMPVTFELVVRWHHEPDTPVRYQLLDIGEGGYRILSSLPMLSGMTGVALRLLPQGKPLNKVVMVAWTNQPPTEGINEIGLSIVEAI